MSPFIPVDGWWHFGSPTVGSIHNSNLRGKTKAGFVAPWRCLEDHPRSRKTVVNNHGDRFRPPKDVGLDWIPSKWPNFVAYKWGLRLPLRSPGMILQVVVTHWWGKNVTIWFGEFDKRCMCFTLFCVVKKGVAHKIFWNIYPTKNLRNSIRCARIPL